jgi:SAM-dependent methyltransferase
MPPVTGRPSPRVLTGVGLVAGATLALQVLLTRLFSAVLFYHFSFVAISLALLGAGSGALLVYLRPAWFARGRVESVLALGSVAFALLVLGGTGVLVRLHYGLSTDVTTSFAVTLGAACLIAALPFLAAGIVIALAVSTYTPWIGRLYAADLAGAGIGAVAVVPMLWLVDAPTLTVALAGVVAVAALLFSPAGSRARWAAGGAMALAVALTVLASSTSAYFLPPQRAVTPGVHLVADRWTPLSRVVGYAPVTARTGEVTYDRDAALVPRYRRGAPVPDWRALSLGPQSIGFELAGPGRALIVGGGGGRDILNALAEHQRRVDVIELNRAIRDVVDRNLRPWSGAPYTLPHVHTTIGDGRSTLAQRDTKYDQIHIGFTNTLSAGSGSSFALAENNLYTVEAFQEYFDHLRPGGILNVSRLYRLAGEEALRATVLTLATLQRRGIRDPRRNVVVIVGTGAQGLFSGTVLARLRPFTDAELARIRALAAQRAQGVAFAPGGPYQLEWRALAADPDLEHFCTHYRIDVCPPTDDRPFFLQVTRLSDVGHSGLGYAFSPNPFVVLLIALGVLALLSALAFVLPLALAGGDARPSVPAVSYFAAIGVGFLMLEIVLVQRFVLFLGFPTYALSVVLFSLLLFTGAGALLSDRWRDPRRALITALAAAIALMLAAAWGLQPLLEALIDLPFGARVATTIALLAPAGLLLGMAMPIGLRRLSALHPGTVAWAWGINGITSVLASVLGIAVAITWGFAWATAVAAACYALALAHAALGRWPAAETDVSPPAAEPAEPVGSRV